MDVQLTKLITIFIIGLFFSGFFSMLEAAIISQDKHRLQYRAEENDKNAIIMQQLIQRMDRLLSALLLCNNLANVTCAASATAIAVKLVGNDDAVIAVVTLLVTFIILVFSEISPKVVGVRYAETIALFSARLIYWLIWILSPVISIANFLSRCLLFIFRLSNNADFKKALSSKEIRSIIRSLSRQHREKEKDKSHHLMLEKTLQFNELSIEKIMTPRPNICGINLMASDDEIVEQLQSTRFSKLPIYNGNIDETQGVIDILDALKMLKNNRICAKNLIDISQPIPYIPVAATAISQLNKMRRENQRIALAIDGAGRIVGLLTFVNFAAAILGDETLPNVKKREDGAYDVPTDIPLRKLEMLDTRFTLIKTNATNLNGMVLEFLGNVPDYPLCLIINGLRIEITEVDEKAIRRAFLLPPHQ